MRKLKEELEELPRPRPSWPSGAAICSARPSCASARCPSWRRPSPRRTRSSRRRRSHGSFLKEEVTDEDIAAVVSKWTGIPVDKMLEGEQARLLHLEERLHARVVGQDEAIARRRQRRAPLARGPRRIRTGPSARSSSSGPPASARPSSRARSPSSSSTTRRTWCASTCPSTWRSTRSRASSARRPGTSATTRAVSSPRRCGAGRTRVVLVRRDREGPPRRLQRAAAAARRRAPHRRPGPHGRLPQHGRHHDLERRQPPRRATASSSARRDHAQAGHGRAAPHLPAGVPEPHRRHRRLPPPRCAREIDRIVDLQLERLRKLLRDRELDLELDARRRGRSSPTRATIRSTARDRSSAPSCATCRIRWPSGSSTGEFAPGDTIWSGAEPGRRGGPEFLAKGAEANLGRLLRQRARLTPATVPVALA